MTNTPIPRKEVQDQPINKDMKKKIKATKIIVFIGTDKDKFYQACLLPDEAQGLLDAIYSWHIGKIKCFKDEFPFEIKRKSDALK